MALNRAMRLIHAWRSADDDLYRDELQRVFREIHAEALEAMEDVLDEETEEDEAARVRAYHATRLAESSQLVHAFVRISNQLADARIGPMGAEDVLKLVDDFLREEDEDHAR